jgi:2-C-methyl-D-erythritol 4-phosphate cytidylyltransferase
VTFAVIAAAGQGSRLGAPVAKFELELRGKPLLLYSLEAFQAAGCVDSIILVVPEERLGSWAAEGLRARGISKATATVPGGATRQESVGRGLDGVPGDAGTVVIHDAARPMVTPALIEATCRIPDDADGVITAVGVTDTIKSVKGAVVASTLERGSLVSVQTPQAFRLDVLRAAHLAAREEGYEGTDDAALVERAGGVVAVIEGSRENIKVTFGEDLARVDAIMGERGKR